MVTPTARSRLLWFRRGLLIAGLAVAAWSVVRVALLLGGVEEVVADDDAHGYASIFSLVLLPVLVVAVWTLVADTVELWRRGRSHRVGPGVALVLSAPLAGGFAPAAAVIGVAIVATAVLDRRHARRWGSETGQHW